MLTGMSLWGGLGTLSLAARERSSFVMPTCMLLDVLPIQQQLCRDSGVGSPKGSHAYVGNQITTRYEHWEVLSPPSVHLIRNSVHICILSLLSSYCAAGSATFGSTSSQL